MHEIKRQVEKQEKSPETQFYFFALFRNQTGSEGRENEGGRLRPHKDDKLSPQRPPQLRALCNTSLSESGEAYSP